MELARKAKEAGVDEIDVVMKINEFKNEKYDEFLKDLEEICAVLPIKVIIGSGYLTDEEVKKASEIVKEAGVICVKTATIKDLLSHSQLPKKAEHVKIMKEAAPGLLIKVAGGIRTVADLKMMMQAGADIIGTSSGVEIVDESQGKEARTTKSNKIIE